MRHALHAVLLLLAPVAAAFDLSGTVVDKAKAPVPGATVWLTREDRVERTETDGAGQFRFTGLDVGNVEVIAHKPGYAMDGFSEVVVDPVSIRLHLREAGTVLLRVIGDEYKPVAGARIRSMIVGGLFFVPVDELTSMGFPSVRSDKMGMLTIADLPARSHVRFIVSHHDFADTLVAYLPVDGKKQNVVLEAGVKLRGRVTTPDGHGAAKAEVSVFRLGSTGRRDFAQTLTDAEGFYTARVPAGDYFVAASHAEYASPEPKPLAVRRQKETQVLDIELLPPHLIEGSVVGPDGKALPGVLLAYWVGDAPYDEILTKHDGTFRLLAPPAEGMIQVVPPDGYVSEGLPDIPVQMGSKTHVKVSPIRLKPLPEIAGIIRDGEGRPAPNVLVVTRSFFPRTWTITEADGRFRLRLERVTADAQAAFRAEHALRFLRSDFAVDCSKPRPVDARLTPFEPDLRPRKPRLGQNDLSSMVGKPAPEIECSAWFNSAPLTLEALRGKTVVATFWGGFDRRPENFDQIEELRVLHALLEDVPDVLVLGIHDSSSVRQDVEEYVEQYRIEFPVGHDAEPFRTFERYRIRDIPQTVLIDKHGVLRYFQVDGRLLELIKVLRREP